MNELKFFFYLFRNQVFGLGFAIVLFPDSDSMSHYSSIRLNMTFARVCSLHYEKFSDGTVKCIEDEIPFEIPDGWTWARLRSLLNLFITGPFGSSLHKSDYVSSGTPLINPMNIVNGRIQANPQMLVSQDTVSRLSVFKVLEGDIVIARRGEMGRCAVVDSSQNGWLCGTGSFDLRVSHLIDSNYIAARIRASDSVTFLSGNSLGNTMLNLNQSILNSLLIPVPPVNEQRRVLCAISEADGLLSTLAESNTKLRSFIVDAKAKILDLAIRGKLVPQDPADEPASVLLERIRANKEEQIKAGKLKRDKKESFIFRGEDNSYYLKRDDCCESLNAWDFGDLPSSWCICLLGEVCDYGNCINVDSESIADGDWVLDLEDIEKDTGKVITRVTKQQRDAVSTKHKFNKGQVLYSKLRPYLNKVVLADGDGYCTSEIIPLEFAAEVHPAYARYFLMSPTFLAYANRCSYGVKMPRLSTADGRTAAFIFPPYKEQVRIAERITSIFEKIDLIQNEI